MTEMVRCFADVVDAATGMLPSDSADPVHAIAALYQAKAAGTGRSPAHWALVACEGSAPLVAFHEGTTHWVAGELAWRSIDCFGGFHACKAQTDKK